MKGTELSQQNLGREGSLNWQLKCKTIWGSIVLFAKQLYLLSNEHMTFYSLINSFVYYMSDIGLGAWNI